MAEIQKQQGALSMTTHLGQTVLFYPGSQKQNHPSSLGTDPIPAIVTKVHDYQLVDLELLTGPTRGLQFTKVTQEAFAGPHHAHPHWHVKEVFDITQSGGVLLDSPT